jgi:hypothetical protein
MQVMMVGKVANLQLHLNAVLLCQTIGQPAQFAFPTSGQQQMITLLRKGFGVGGTDATGGPGDNGKTV